MADSYLSAQETARRTGRTTGAPAKWRYLKKAPTAGSTSRPTPLSTRKVKWSNSSSSAGRPDMRFGAHAAPRTQRRRSPMHRQDFLLQIQRTDPRRALLALRSEVRRKGARRAKTEAESRDHAVELWTEFRDELTGCTKPQPQPPPVAPPPQPAPRAVPTFGVFVDTKECSPDAPREATTGWRPVRMGTSSMGAGIAGPAISRAAPDAALLLRCATPRCCLSTGAGGNRSSLAWCSATPLSID
jgi:hypothetical protein